MTKPDFIIIGAMKSATSTVHQQLAMQPGIFMTTPKEPNYFSDDEHYARGESWYDSLFEGAQEGDLCGESSTHYTKLPDYPLTIDRMKNRLDRLKLIYVMRHPVDRLVSHYMHQWSQNVFKCDINEAIDIYPELISYSRYAMQLEPYLKAYGAQNILPVFTEALRIRPESELSRIAKFIGYKEQVRWYESCAEQNVSTERIREFPGYDLLINSSFMTWLRRRFVPKAVRNRIKKNFTLQQRPVIDDAHLERLNQIFDKDLALLGKWMGCDLSTENYKDSILKENLGFEY